MQTLRDRSLSYLFVLSIATLTIFLGYSWSRLVSPAAAATTFIVFNTNDGGAGSLRQAINNANASPGVDTIKFNLPAGGGSTLTPGSPLPTITDPVIIDGYSQIGTSPNTQADGINAALVIEIDGTNVGVVDPCLTITAGGTTVRGLVINRCRFGMRLDGAGGNTIQGNFSVPIRQARSDSLISSAFPVTLTPAQFVDGLIANTGVAFTDAERTVLINLFFGAPTSADQAARARALRLVAENPTFAAAEFNRTFVTMEYFGYLRRDPDASGFNFWLNKLNSFNGNFVEAEMVKSFIISSEYRQRFGAN